MTGSWKGASFCVAYSYLQARSKSRLLHDHDHSRRGSGDPPFHYGVHNQTFLRTGLNINAALVEEVKKVSG